MADKKISQLTDGTSLQSGDFVVVARSGNNFKVDPTQFGSDINLGDNVKATFGDSSDLQIYHDGSNSYITDVGTGSLIIDGSSSTQIKGSSFVILRSSAGENMAVGNTDGSFDIYYNGAKKLETTATGIDVTGTVTADGLTVDGGVQINSSLSLDATAVNIDLVETDLVDVNTRLRQTSGDFYIQSLNDAKTVATNRFSVDHSTGDIRFYEDTGTTPAFFWDASAEALGIGTTNPNRGILHVQGSNYVLTNSGQSLGGIHIDADTAPVAGGYTNGISFGYTSGASAIVGVTSNASADADRQGLAFIVHNSSVGGADAIEAMRLDSDGNVGIGTSSPAELLHLGGATNKQIRIDSSKNPGYVGAFNDSLNLAVNRRTVDGSIINADRSAAFISLNGQDGGSSVTFFTANANNTTPTEAMRIDSSGNLLVGTTSASQDIAGFRVFSTGRINASDSTVPIIAARLSTDGEVIRIAKDGTTVGRIGTSGGDMFAGTGDTGLCFVDADDAIVPWNTSTNAGRDVAVDLGASATRFRNLYLSNGIQLSNGAAVLSTSSSAKISMYGGATNRGGQIDFYGGLNTNGILVFRTGAGAGEQPEIARFDSGGNLLVGGTGTPTSSAGNFVLYNGTAPTGNATDGVILYAEDVSASSELKVRDEAGNVTTLSPHNFDLIPEGPSEDMAWSYYSERDGKRINVDMLKAIRLLEQLSGEKLVHIV